MQMVKKLLLTFLILPFAIMILMPKQELYYLLEERLKEQNIIITGETLDEGILSLTILHPEIYISGISIATAEKVDLWSLLFYSKVHIKNLHIADGLPYAFSLDTVNMVHYVFTSEKISIVGQGSIGGISGNINLDERVIHIDMETRLENTILRKELKKGEKGWYYESKF